MRREFLLFLILTLIVFGGNVCSGQPSFEQLTSSPIYLHHLSRENGLSHTNVHDIIKDHEGYIWIATKNGLNRFDSYNFEVFKHSIKDTTSIGDSNTWCVFEDSKNRLWVGTNQGGLNLFNRRTENFKKYTHDPNNDSTISQNGITSIIEDHKGKLWVGTFWGLNEFDPDTETFKRHYYANDWSGSVLANYITCLMEDNKYRIWVGTEKGISVYNRNTKTFKNFESNPTDKHSLASNKIRDIHQDSEGNIWIATEGGGVSIYDEVNDNFHNIPTNPGDDTAIQSDIVRCIIEDKKGNIWFGTDGAGVNIYNKATGKFKVLQSQNIPDFNRSGIDDIYLDDNGITWFAQYGKGLLNFNRYKKPFNSIRNFNTKDSLFSASSVLSFAKDHNNNTWIGTDNNGLFKFNPKEKTFSHLPLQERGSNAVSNYPIKSLMVDKSNNLWAGTYTGGLFKVNLKSLEITRFRHNPTDKNSINGDNIWALYQDNTGNIWIGTLGKGLDKYIPGSGKFIHYPVNWNDDSSISSNAISVIYEDSEGRLWVGTEGGGINLLNEEKNGFIHYQHFLGDTTGIINNEIMVIYEDQKNNLWVGTNGGGLHRYNTDKDRFDRFEIKGDKYDAIYGILEDDQGNLWMTSNNGIYVLDTEKRVVKTYNVYDGLQGNEYNYNAQLKCSNGLLYFGGINGFDHFNPENIKRDPFSPKIVITDFYLFHKQPSNTTGNGLEYKQINYTKKITLTPSQYVFGFKYAALDYSFPKNNKYAFKLEGFDSEWNYVGNTREATYTNIPPGTYDFKVRTTTNNGVWNNTSLSIEVTILPPWWDIIWVQVLLALLGIAFVFSIIRLRTRMLVNKKQTLENEVKKRVHQIELQKLEIEDKNEELQQQNEKIWKSHEHIQHQNDELKAKNEIILHQGKQVNEKSALLEKAHEEIKIANNELKRINADLEKMVDIRTSELKEAMKKLIKSDEELNTFLYRSSHDLRGPITTLLGLTRLAQKENKDPQIDPYFEKINNSCHNMIKVLKKLNETNVVFKSKRVASKINVNEIVQHIELDLNQFDQDQEVRKEFHANIDHDVYSDELLLKTIIYNLMENSIIYRTVDDPYVKLELNANKEALEIVVTDNGLGIRDDIMPHIYKMFYRGSEHSTGNGLGLYLVQKSVELLNGKIHLESEQYKFTKFVVTIPNEQKDSVKKLDEIYMEKHSF